MKFMKRLTINGHKTTVVTIERGYMKILWISTEPRLIRICRTEPITRLPRPTMPFLCDSLIIANHDDRIKYDATADRII